MNIRSTGRGTFVVIVIVVSMLVSGVAMVPVGATTPPEEEPNDDREDAMEISLDTEITGEVPNGSDEDWYAFEAEAGEVINLSTEIIDGGNLKYSIIDPDGNQIQNTRGGEGSFGTSVTAPQSGTYYLRVFYWFGDNASQYSFTLSTFSTTDREPNEDRGNATPYTVGETIEDTITIGDHDWYAYDVEAGETINLTADLGPGGGIRFTIDRPNGESLDRAQGSNTALLGGVTAPVSGTYYLHVRKMGGDTGADYSFTLRTYTTTDREPNEDPGNATGLSLNTTVEDTLSLSDEDWYAFDLQDGNSISVVAEGLTEGGKTVSIVSPEQEPLNGTTVGTGTDVVNATANGTGTYYVHVHQSSAPGGDYSLDIRTNGSTDTQPAENPGTDEDGDDGDTGDGGGPPVIPIAIVLALVVLVVIFVLRRRDSDDDGGGRR